MKHCNYYLLTFLCFVLLTTHPKKDDDDAPIVLQNFGTMVGSFLCMLQDPENSEHALPCIKEMVQGMINIAQVAFRRGDRELLEKQLTRFFDSQAGQNFLLEWQQIIAEHAQKSTI